MAGYLLKGVLIGLIFGLPVGAVGAMTVQRTINGGTKAGLLTGLGSSVADCIYAVIGALGITLISDFLLKYQLIIHALGGLLLLFMGIKLFLKQKQNLLPNSTAAGFAKLFLSSFAIGITNPAAILTFLFAFSYFGISGPLKLHEGVPLVCGVFIGTYFWWGAVAYAAHKAKESKTFAGLTHSNKVFGTVLVLISAIILSKSIFA